MADPEQSFDSQEQQFTPRAPVPPGMESVVRDIWRMQAEVREKRKRTDSAING